MKIIGLTGSIGAGKTTVCEIFKQIHLPVFEADHIVHQLFTQEKSLINNILKFFPQAVNNDQINRKVLGELVINDQQKLLKLEKIVHPFVKQELDKFLKNHQLNNSKTVMIEAPLLYEVGWHRFCDLVIVVSCFNHLQRKRVLSRENMTFEKFLKLKKRQLPDFIKRKKADLIINTNYNVKRVINFCKKLKMKDFNFNARNSFRYRNHRF